MLTAYTDMIPDALYRADNHLYVYTRGAYYFIAYDHLSELYIPPWKKQATWMMEHLKLERITEHNLTAGLRVKRDSKGNPIRFVILTYGGTHKDK